MLPFLVTLIKLLALLLVFGAGFSFLPKFAYGQVSKLLVYHDYSNEVLKNKFSKVIRVYLVLGLTLGFVFIFLFAGLTNTDLNQIQSPNLKINSSGDLIMFSFIMSFLLVVSLRISALLNKTNIIVKFLPKRHKTALILSSKAYDYNGLRSEIKSFLFSIFLSGLLGLMILYSYKLIYQPEEIIGFNINIGYGTLLKFAIFLVSFIIGFSIITFLGELALHKLGVHPDCRDQFKDEDIQTPLETQTKSAKSRGK